MKMDDLKNENTMFRKSLKKIEKYSLKLLNETISSKCSKLRKSEIKDVRTILKKIYHRSVGSS